MLVAQKRWTAATGWTDTNPVATPLTSAQLVIFFGARAAITDCDIQGALRRTYPDAHVLGCTTAGEICGTTVSDDSVAPPRFGSTIHPFARPIVRWSMPAVARR
jgi:hypothetical protein